MLINIFLLEAREEAHTKLIHFIRTSEFYNPERLFGRLPKQCEPPCRLPRHQASLITSFSPSSALYEARAILLGRLGRHEAALEIYVYRLHNYDEAEESALFSSSSRLFLTEHTSYSSCSRYCKTVYEKSPDPKGVFLSLLRIYLRPSPESDLAISPPSSPPARALSPASLDSAQSSQSLLIPALDLISRHSARLDSSSVLSLLPPLVPTSAVHTFLLDALDPSRSGKGEGGKMGRTIREVWKARKQEVDSRYVALRSRKVRITDTRM